jgi:hypothetical protein
LSEKLCSRSFLLVWILAGCAPPTASPVGCAPDAPPAAAEEALVEGEYTAERPEVGIFSSHERGCTGTLVGARDVLTASHCVAYESRTTPGEYGTFYVRRDTDTHAYTVEQYVSYGRGVGEDDVAILRLATAVPLDIATPAGIAETVPEDGTPVTIYGYGCQARGGSATWARQSLATTWGAPTANLCPGDSGGPTMTRDGLVVRVNSGYVLDAAGEDVFGVVPVVYDRIEAQAAAWGDVLGTSTAAGCAVRGTTTDAP